jgi:DNA-binding PadR family transcriptional regulator
VSTQLFTFSLIRSLYDQGDDIIDSFWPLVINVLPRDKSSLPIEKVQKEIEEHYGLKVPQHSLGTIIKRAAKKGYVERAQKSISLTPDGLTYFDQKIEPEREANRRVNELLADAKAFMERALKTVLSLDQIKGIIQAFILENLETLEQFFTDDGAPTHSRNTFSTDSERVLVDYFTDVEKTKPLIFQTLQDIVCGSVISAIVHTRELFQESGRKFDKTVVYLDSNYVFSLLNLRYDEENKPAQELFTLMKEEGTFDFKVFDFTLHEITGVLRNYEKEERYYQPHIKVRNSLFASLKARGWTPAKVREFIVNVEERLWDELQVSIGPTEINLGKYEADASRRALLAQYKPDQASREQNHDLAAIDRIRALRRKDVRRIEKAQAIFLTSDMKLALFNYIGEEHKEKDTISEVIPDRLLTNILWLKNPAASDKFSLDSIIANYSRNLFVDQTVWKQFYKNLVELRIEGSLDDTQVSILLYDRHLQEMLSEYEPDEMEEIDPEKILKNIEKIREEKPEEVQKASQPSPIPDQTEDMRSQLTALQEKVNRVEQEKNDMMLRTIERWKKVQELDAERDAKAINVVIKGIFVVAMLLFAFYIIGPLKRHWLDVEPVVWLITVVVLGLVLPILGIHTDPFNWSHKVYDRVFNFALRRRLKNLEKLELSFTVDTEAQS